MSDAIIVEELKVYSSLFKLVTENGLVDLTNNIVVPTYKINKNPVYTEWTDGDLINHRDIHRYRVEGSFTLMFNDKDDFNSFVSSYNSALTDNGQVGAVLYINNHNKIETRSVFMDFELENNMPFMGVKEIDGIEVTIKEV